MPNIVFNRFSTSNPEKLQICNEIKLKSLYDTFILFLPILRHHLSLNMRPSVTSLPCTRHDQAVLDLTTPIHHHESLRTSLKIHKTYPAFPQPSPQSPISRFTSPAQALFSYPSPVTQYSTPLPPLSRTSPSISQHLAVPPPSLLPSLLPGPNFSSSPPPIHNPQTPLPLF